MDELLGKLDTISKALVQTIGITKTKSVTKMQSVTKLKPQTVSETVVRPLTVGLS